MNMQKENSLNVKIIKINGNSFMDIGSNIKQSNRSIDIFITLNNKKIHAQCTIHAFLVLQALQNNETRYRL